MRSAIQNDLQVHRSKKKRQIHQRSELAQQTRVLLATAATNNENKGNITDNHVPGATHPQQPPGALRVVQRQ